MNLGELENSLHLAVQDQSLIPYFTGWINLALLELAADLELPALKTVSPTSLVVHAAAWVYALPADFHKKLYRCVDSDYDDIKICRTMDELDDLDLDHDDTGDHVTAVAVTDAQIGVYPLAAETLRLWYYKKPTVLTNKADVPTCIPASYHSRVIIPQVTLKVYEHLQDQVENFDIKGLQYWQAKLSAGLNGSPAEGIGLKNYLAKIQGGPKRHGGRDPIWTGR